MPEAKSEARALARVDPRWDAAQTERALAGLHRRRARRRATAVLAVTTAMAALTLLAWTFATPTTAPTASPARPTTHEAGRVVRLADGSRVTADEGAEIVVDHVSDARIAVRVERGAADLEVVPGLTRRFEVRAGEVTVTVLGTAFRVERLDAGRVRVSVTRGHVDVSWPAGHADLVAGQGGIFPTPELAAADTPLDETIATAQAPAVVTRDRPARESSPAPRAWRDLARASRYDDAYAALGSPAERAAAIGDDVEDLLLAADVARLSGHPAEALPWLATVERDHASDPRAVLATFTRGRLLMDLGRHAEAADELERAIAMEPGGSLAEDALARAALAHAAAGHAESASRLADRYLLSYPDGRWARRVRTIGSGVDTR